jgi:hypothetical protein
MATVHFATMTAAAGCGVSSKDEDENEDEAPFRVEVGSFSPLPADSRCSALHCGDLR